MNLSTYSEEQVRVVEQTAKAFMRLVQSNPSYNLERGIAEWRRNHPLAQGISNREIVSEILMPGSFRGEDQ